MKKYFPILILFFLLLINSLCASAQTLTSITTLPVTLTSNCAPLTFSVSFTTNGVANPGNQFQVEISDTAGSFSQRYYGGGSISSTIGGTINCSILNPPTSNRYRIRVVSTNPAIIGSKNSTDLLMVSKPNTYGMTDVNNYWQTFSPNFSYSAWSEEPTNWAFSNNAVIDSGQNTKQVWGHYIPSNLSTPTILTISWKTVSYGCYGNVRYFTDTLFPTMTNISMPTFAIPHSTCSPDIENFNIEVNGNPGPTNFFKVQLSDTNGTFLNPTILDTVWVQKVSHLKYVLTTTILSKYTSGHYRMRITSSDPPLVSNDNGTDLFLVKGVPDTLASINACNAVPIQLSVTPSGGTFDIANPNTGSISTRYTYSYVGNYGCTESKTGMINRTKPASQIGPIITVYGVAKMCPGQTKNYAVDSIPGTTYFWTVPVGATILVGQGTSKLGVWYTNAFTQAGNITVAVSNSCGSQTFTLLIERNDPPQPTTISGLNYGVCSLSNVNYSISAVTGYSYLWTTSTPDAVITSGQNRSYIKVNFSPAFITGTISLSLKNSCGTSVPRIKTVYAKPAGPSSVTGSSSVCANQLAVPYSIPLVNNTTNYTWVGPTGSRISDGVTTSTTNSLVTTATSVNVNFSTSAGTVKARANNTCGSGSYKSLAVSIVCREAGELNNINPIYFDVFPNPASDEITLSFYTNETESYAFTITDILGKEILTSEGTANYGENKINASLQNINSGIYFITLKHGNYSLTKKLIVE